MLRIHPPEHFKAKYAVDDAYYVDEVRFVKRHLLIVTLSLSLSLSPILSLTAILKLTIYQLLQCVSRFLFFKHFVCGSQWCKQSHFPRSGPVPWTPTPRPGPSPENKTVHKLYHSISRSRPRRCRPDPRRTTLMILLIKWLNNNCFCFCNQATVLDLIELRLGASPWENLLELLLQPFHRMIALPDTHPISWLHLWN